MNPMLFNIDVYETLAYCRPLVAHTDPGKLLYIYIYFCYSSKHFSLQILSLCFNFMLQLMTMSAGRYGPKNYHDNFF